MAYLDPDQPRLTSSESTHALAGDPVRADRPPRRRSVAWVYYTILAVLAVVASFSVGPSAILPAVLCGAYATYLFRGGRIVLWIW
jgi:hypothetical protein